MYTITVGPRLVLGVDYWWPNYMYKIFVLVRHQMGLALVRGSQSNCVRSLVHMQHDMLLRRPP